MQKSYILDSSVLLSFPRAIFAFDDNEVIIPSCVIDEIGNIVRHGGEGRGNAVEVNNLLDNLYLGGDSAISLKNGGSLRVVAADTLYRAARARTDSIIVSRDPGVRLKAKCYGLHVEPYKSDDPAKIDNPYPGRKCLYVSDAEMTHFAREKNLELNPDCQYEATDCTNVILDCVSRDNPLVENEYLMLINTSNPTGGTLLGRFRGGKIVSIRNSTEHPVYEVTSRNVAQAFALDALMDPNIPLVILRGPAGTGKTFLSMAAGLQQTLEDRRYRRILLTRPNAKMDADVGFLKGDEKEKMLPSLRGLTDNVDNLMPGSRSMKKDGVEEADPLEYLFDRRIIEVQALAYMRGRSITNQFILVDEMQNSPVSQVLSIITRLGEGSKIVIMGDPDQIDNPYLDRLNNGLVYAADRMFGSKLCCQVSFMESESTRSPLAKEAIERLSPKGSRYSR